MAWMPLVIADVNPIETLPWATGSLADPRRAPPDNRNLCSRSLSFSSSAAASQWKGPTSKVFKNALPSRPFASTLRSMPAKQPLTAFVSQSGFGGAEFWVPATMFPVEVSQTGVQLGAGVCGSM